MNNSDSLSLVQGPSTCMIATSLSQPPHRLHWLSIVGIG
jgi:hypothetical protein